VCACAHLPLGTTWGVHLVPGPKVQHALGLLRGHQVVAAEQAQCVAAAGIILEGGQEGARVNIPVLKSASKVLSSIVSIEACKTSEACAPCRNGALRAGRNKHNLLVDHPLLAQSCVLSGQRQRHVRTMSGTLHRRPRPRLCLSHSTRRSTLQTWLLHSKRQMQYDDDDSSPVAPLRL